MNHSKGHSLEIISRSLRNSLYYTQQGLTALSYVNLDVGIFGDDDMPHDFKQQRNMIELLTADLSEKISEIAKERGISRLAFIDKGGQGPVGVLSLACLLVLKSEIAGLLVRPYKKTWRSMIRGRRITLEEEILVVSDVATTGRTVLSAAEIIRNHGGRARIALVVYDQGTGARENLAAKGIELVSLNDKKTVEESDNEALKANLAPPKTAYMLI